MNDNNQKSMLDVETNLLAGIFILLVLVAIKVGTGGNFDIDQDIGGGNKSDIPYKVYPERPKDSRIAHVYIELTGAVNTQGIKLALQGSTSSERSCSLSFAPFHSISTWVATRKTHMVGNWQIVVLNPPPVSQKVFVKINVFLGSRHSCSVQFQLTRGSSMLINFHEYGNDSPTITFGNNENCL
ncbi:MAG: hypothetical protein AAF502_17215 [Bacteroidota bacterium]